MKAAANKWTQHCPAQQVVNKLLEHKKEKKKSKQTKT